MNNIFKNDDFVASKQHQTIRLVSRQKHRYNTTLFLVTTPTIGKEVQTEVSNISLWIASAYLIWSIEVRGRCHDSGGVLVEGRHELNDPRGSGRAASRVLGPSRVLPTAG